VKVAAPTSEEIGSSATARPRRLPRAADLAGHDARARRREGHRVRDGGDPAHQPRAVDGRAVVAVERRGYKAALLGAEHATRFYPMLTTAAGTIPPAKVLVLGGGVAGLQALATAKRLGARTTGYDVRPEVAEQVQSLGANWLDLGIEAAGEGGYARELTEEERGQQQQALTDAIKEFDVVITTALVPGARRRPS
jgi:NADPH-dependent 2,4-dienoyl-CoA reductase/sulfur reductase-like enzyme